MNIINAAKFMHEEFDVQDVTQKISSLNKQKVRLVESFHEPGVFDK